MKNANDDTRKGSASVDRIRGGRLSKVERYKWSIADKPGVFLEIPKQDLHIDRRYQRLPTDPKVLAIASDWSWIACLALGVVERDGVFYIFEGQHRHAAAMRRSDITTLPCMVFTEMPLQGEAEAFLAANTLRKPLTGVERFNAQVVSEHPTALFLDALLKRHGRTIGGPGKRSVRCVSSLMALAERSQETLERLFPLIDEICGDEEIKHRIAEALCYMEHRMPNGESLTKNPYKERLLRLGLARLLNEAAAAAAFYEEGGAKAWATGIVKAINHKCRSKRLTLPGLVDNV